MANSSTPPPSAPHVDVSVRYIAGRGRKRAAARSGRTTRFLRTLTGVPGRRSVVDYSLQRRAVLAGVYAGRTGLFEVCDASPYLTRAAKYHGEATDVPCPVCRKERLTLVSYVYGEHLGPTAGQAKTEAELARMDAAQEEFSVYTVEVCRGCGWNHLDASYVLGTEPAPGRSPRRRRRAATE